MNVTTVYAIDNKGDNMQDTCPISTRISCSLFKQFEETCTRMKHGVTPSAMLRILIQEFVAKNPKRKLDINLVIDKPPHFSDGAYKFKITLGEKEKAKCEMFEKIGFQIPSLKNRSILPDADYRIAVPMKEPGGVEVRGSFKSGQWEAIVYTNGVSEDRNETPINFVGECLLACVEDALAPFMSL
jgi:hypothetical protein